MKFAKPAEKLGTDPTCALNPKPRTARSAACNYRPKTTHAIRNAHCAVKVIPLATRSVTKDSRPRTCCGDVSGKRSSDKLKQTDDGEAPREDHSPPKSENVNEARRRRGRTDPSPSPVYPAVETTSRGPRAAKTRDSRDKGAASARIKVRRPLQTYPGMRGAYHGRIRPTTTAVKAAIQALRKKR